MKLKELFAESLDKDGMHADVLLRPNETKAIETDNELPAPLPDPFGVAFTDSDLEALTDTQLEEAVKLVI